MEKTYRWMRLYRIPVYQKRVLVGQKLLPTRLVITLVDEQIYALQIPVADRIDFQVLEICRLEP